MTDQKRILLVVTGHTLEPVRSQFGNTDKHFVQAIGTEHLVERYTIFDDHESRPYSNLNDFDGVIMTGSVSMVSDELPWVHACKSIASTCLVDDIPFLGVCFGHQILGAVCGATVGPNPMGRTIGSCLVTVQQKAPIFETLPDAFWVQVSHRDVILEDRNEFQVIATAPHDARHAIQVGRSAFGVQFHPEWDINISRGYIEARQELLGPSVAQQMRETLTESKVAPMIVRQFIDLCGQNRGDKNDSFF